MLADDDLREKIGDRLLELATRHGDRGALLRLSLAACDGRRDDDEFVLRLFEQFGVETEELGGRNHRLDFRPRHRAVAR